MTHAKYELTLLLNLRNRLLNLMDVLNWQAVQDIGELVQDRLLGGASPTLQRSLESLLDGKRAVSVNLGCPSDQMSFDLLYLFQRHN